MRLFLGPSVYGAKSVLELSYILQKKPNPNLTHLVGDGCEP